MNLSLSARVHAGFGVAALMALLMTGTAWWLSWEYERDNVHEHQDKIQATIALAEAESALWQLRYGFPQFMVGDAALRRQILEEEPKWYAIVESRLDTYARASHGTEHLQMLADLRAAYLRYKEARPKFFELYQAGRVEEAAAWRALTTTPYGATTVKALETQIARERAEVAEDAREDIERLRVIQIVLAAVSGMLLAVLAAAYWVALRSLRPVRELHATAVRTVSEQLGQEIDAAAAGDEVAALEQSFHQMTLAFGARAAELEAARSKLEERVAERTRELEGSLAQLAQRNRDAALLSELSGLLQTCASIEEAGTMISTFCRQAFAGTPGAIYLINASRNRVERAAAWGEPTPSTDFVPAECWALRRGRTHRAHESEIALACAHARPEAADAVCIPLSAQGDSLGVLHLEADAAAGGLAQPLAEQLSLALANLKLRATLRDQSIRDALTDLHNRRYLEESLERELARATRGRKPLAVFMLDVDHFKRYNDRFGHDGGDAALRALGRALKGACRASDLACRFGGEEFTVVLPDAGAAAACSWAERLLADVRALTVKSGERVLDGITVSMGLAVHPENGADAETLLQAADLALYEAKRGGRNRLVVAGPALEMKEASV